MFEFCSVLLLTHISKHPWWLLRYVLSDFSVPLLYKSANVVYRWLCNILAFDSEHWHRIW